MRPDILQRLTQSRLFAFHDALRQLIAARISDYASQPDDLQSGVDIEKLRYRGFIDPTHVVSIKP